MEIRHFAERVAPAQADLVAELDFDERQRAQGRVVTTSGEAVGIFIERGTSLKHLDHLRSSDGAILRVEAKPERLSVVETTLGTDLTRAAYHLGNRHVRLEIGQSFVAFQEAHVLDDMVRALGFEVRHEARPFEPEGGAYHRGHGHDHEPAHSHDHGPSHGHGHGSSHHLHGLPDSDAPLIFKVRP